MARSDRSLLPYDQSSDAKSWTGAGYQDLTSPFASDTTDQWCLWDPTQGNQNQSSSDEDEQIAMLPQPTINWKDVAIARYLAFIRSDQSEVNPWISLVLDASSGAHRDHPHFNDALAAVSLQRLSRVPRFKVLSSRAAAYHGRALRLFGRALVDAVHGSSDISLLSVRLLIIYSGNVMVPVTAAPGSNSDETRENTPRYSTDSDASSSSFEEKLNGLPTPASGHGSDSPDPRRRSPMKFGDDGAVGTAVAAHFDGLLRMLLVRGPRQLENQSTCQLYHSVRDRVVSNYCRRCKCLPISRAEPQWAWFFDSPSINSASDLTNIAVDLPLIRFRACSLQDQAGRSFRCQAARTLKNDAYYLISSLKTWYAQLPDSWRQPQIAPIGAEQLAKNMSLGYEGPTHLYPEPLVAMVIGRYYTYQIMLLQIISLAAEAELGYDDRGRGSASYSDELHRQESRNAEANQRAMVDSICGVLAVYNLRDNKVFEVGRERASPGGLQHGGHLIEPILISQLVPSVPEHQKLFLRAKMREMLLGAA